MTDTENLSRDSLLFWYPKIKSLDIPQPKTEIVVLTKEELNATYDERIASSLTEKVEDVIFQEFKLPVFIRTDLSSAKHYWKNTCFYDGTDELQRHLWEIIEFNLCADVMGLPFKALVVREFIAMDSRFTAFCGDMFVNPERRYFIDKGKVLCHHAYWFSEAIKKGGKKPNLENWEELLEEINIETKDEIKLLTGYAQMIAKVLPRFWSIDFCRAKDGRWILIDLATGERSWHPKDCKFNRTIEVDYLKEGLRLLEGKDLPIKPRKSREK